MNASGLSAALTLAALGCSDVFVEPGGAGGRSGTGDRTDVGTAESATSSTTGQSSSSTGFDPALNDAFCEAVGLCFPSCTVAFQTFQYPPCEAEGAALVTCMIAHYDVEACSLAGCDAEIQALSTCRSNIAYSCGFGGGCIPHGYDECDSNSVCTDGDRWILCTRDGDQAECACYFNSVLFGTCTGEWKDNGRACSLKTGCCASLFGTCDQCAC